MTELMHINCYCISIKMPKIIQIRPSLDDSMAASVASALTSSCLDQLNSILYGTPLKHTARLQRIQHAVARVVLYQHSRTSPLSSNELLKQLHWLPIEWRIQFKLATMTMTFKALHTDRPPYLFDLLQHHEPKRSLRSSSSHQLLVPRHKLTFGYLDLVLFGFLLQEFGIHYL